MLAIELTPDALSDLLTVIEMTLAADMPDEVRAKLHKITGLVLRAEQQPEQALEHLARAMQLDVNAGVKKDIERLERELKPVPPAAPAKPKTAPSVRKAKPKTAPAKRGRPRKI